MKTEKPVKVKLFPTRSSLAGQYNQSHGAELSGNQGLISLMFVFFFSFGLFPLVVASAIYSSPHYPLLFTNSLHFLFHYVHKSALCFSFCPPACQFQPQRPSTDVFTVPPLSVHVHVYVDLRCLQFSKPYNSGANGEIVAILISFQTQLWSGDEYLGSPH